jgi:hypothetical protein
MITSFDANVFFFIAQDFIMNFIETNGGDTSTYRGLKTLFIDIFTRRHEVLPKGQSPASVSFNA